VVAPRAPDGNLQNSVVKSIEVRGDGASIQTPQWVSDHISSTGPLGDLTLQSDKGITDVTAPSIFGSIVGNGSITGTVQTTGLRTDPITGTTAAVAANLGRLFVTTTDHGPILTTTQVQGNGAGLTGRLITRGDLISQVVVKALSGLLAVQGNINETNATDKDGHPVRLGGLVVNGDVSGQTVVLGTAYADVFVSGGLKSGRFAVKGSILGNLTINGDIDLHSAVVTAGSIGSATAGTVMHLGGHVLGVLAAEGSISFNQLNASQAAYYGQNLKTTDPTSAAAIDAIFTQGGAALGFDQSGLDLGGLNMILTDLAALHVGSNGKLTGPVA
jgi:hypothetical protein